MTPLREQLLTDCNVLELSATFKHNAFLDGLTSKQYQAWLRSRTVPKALKHQTRHKAWQDAIKAYRPLRARLKLYLIEET